jgi:hypothetical protein
LDAHAVQGIHAQVRLEYYFVVQVAGPQCEQALQAASSHLGAILVHVLLQVVQVRGTVAPVPVQMQSQDQAAVLAPVHDSPVRRVVAQALALGLVLCESPLEIWFMAVTAMR